MELEDIRSLIGVAQSLGLAELEASKNGVTLRLVRDGAAAHSAFVDRTPSQQVPSPRASADLIAPLSGVLHLAASPEAPPFVTAGQAVQQGDTLCIIEAMKVFNRVSAERAGTIQSVLFETGAEIEAGQTVMRIT